MPISIDLHPTALAVLGDELATGARRGSGRSLASRIAAKLRAPDRRLLPLDLSGRGGLGGAIRRWPASQSSLDGQTPWGVVLLGLEDAASDLPISWWLSDAEALVDQFRNRCARVVVAVPPPIVEGVGDAGRWSTKEVRRWARRVPALLARQVAELEGVEVVTLEEFPRELRADDAWPKDEGLDWIADRIAAAFGTSSQS